MLYLTCTTITSVDLAHYVVSHAKDWVSVDCGTIIFMHTRKCANRGLRRFYLVLNWMHSGQPNHGC